MDKICKCEQSMKWIKRVLCVCCLILLVFFAVYIFYYHSTHFMEFCMDVVSWEMITALATTFAAVCAFIAYLNSKEMKEQSSFDIVFAQILANFRSYQTDSRLLSTKQYGTDGETKTIQDSTFWSFCEKYQDETTENNVAIMQTVNSIKNIWADYSKSLVYRANFLNTFKYIYYIVDLVDSSPLDQDMKRKYVKIVQSQLNMDILFCYLINLISAHNGESNGHIKRLQKYEFFKNIFKDNERYKPLIVGTIPYDVYELFYKKNEDKIGPSVK